MRITEDAEMETIRNEFTGRIAESERKLKIAVKVFTIESLLTSKRIRLREDVTISGKTGKRGKTGKKERNFFV